MSDLQELVRFMDETLKVGDIPDYPGALNGLQLENAGVVNKVGAAVDASLAVFRRAVDEGVDLLIVHHGMFWQGAQVLTGPRYQKLKWAMDHDLAVYSAHIPLDVHPVLGNNALLAKAIGMDAAMPFFDWKGIQLGLMQELDLGRGDLLARLEQAVGGDVHLCPGGAESVGRVGLITGGAGTEVEAVAACGIDTFITGEGSHWTYPLAEELGVNLLYAGHYATETFGVRALARRLEQEYALESTFIDHPTGL